MRQHLAIRRRNNHLNLLKCLAASLAVFALTASSVAQYPQTQWPETTPQPAVQPSQQTQAQFAPGTPTPAMPQQHPGTVQIPQPAAIQPVRPATVWPQANPAATNVTPAQALTPIQPVFQPAIQPAAVPTPAPAEMAPPFLISAEGDVAPNPNSAAAPATSDATPAPRSCCYS